MRILYEPQPIFPWRKRPVPFFGLLRSLLYAVLAVYAHWTIQIWYRTLIPCAWICGDEHMVMFVLTHSYAADIHGIYEIPYDYQAIVEVTCRIPDFSL